MHRQFMHFLERSLLPHVIAGVVQTLQSLETRVCSASIKIPSTRQEAVEPSASHKTTRFVPQAVVGADGRKA